MPHQRYGFHQSLYMRDTYESFVLGRLFPLGFSFSPESCSDVHSTYKGGWAGGRPAQSIRMGWPVGRSPTPYLWWAKLRAEFATARLWSGNRASWRLLHQDAPFHARPAERSRLRERSFRREPTVHPCASSTLCLSHERARPVLSLGACRRDHAQVVALMGDRMA